MIFCPKCGSLLKPKIEGSKKFLACSCGYKTETEGFQLKETNKKKTQKIEVAEERMNALPKTKAKCTKCGNNEAYWWMVQTRAADEAATRFLRCTKCRHTWREND